MAKFQKGLPRPIGAGRKAGTPNKSTTEFKKAISELISGNVDNLQTWLDYVAKDNPVKAFDLLIKMMEFVIPKLSRTEGSKAEQGGRFVVAAPPTSASAADWLEECQKTL